MAMMQTRFASAIALALGWLAFAQSAEQEPRNTRPPVPLADHHQHLFSPELAALMTTSTPVAAVKPRTAADLIEQLDAAGIKRAVVLSTAYIYEQPSRKADHAAEKLKRDNDWTSKQVAQFPDRLIGFCGLDPLKDYALEELARCAADPNLRRGLKLHFGNSVVDYHNPNTSTVTGLPAATTVGWRSWRTSARRSQRCCRGAREALIERVTAAPDVVVSRALRAPDRRQRPAALEILVDAVARTIRDSQQYFRRDVGRARLGQCAALGRGDQAAPDPSSVGPMTTATTPAGV